MKNSYKRKVLFVCPMVSEHYLELFETIANKRWKDAKFLKRDLKRHERFTKRVFYGMGLLTLASLLDENFSFDYIDENFEPDNLKQLYDNCEDYDFVALTGQVVQWKRTMELIQLFKQKGLYVVVGGVHATTFFDDYIQNGVSVIIGEGESLFKTFLNDFFNKNPKPVYQKQSSDENLNPAQIPIPDFEIISQNRYNAVGVQTTRGCPYRCHYCNVSDILGSKYRHKPVDRVVEEVKYVKKYWPDSEFLFFDDNLFADRKYAVELFSAIRDNDVYLGNWATHADISIFKKHDLLDLISQNGTPRLAFGFETLSKKNAGQLGNRMKQKLQPKYDEAITEIKNRGIVVTGSFMLGFKGDSSETVEEIFEFLKRFDIRCYVSKYSALPGTKMYQGILNDYVSENGILNEKGVAQAQIINRYLTRKNGFGEWDVEDMILDQVEKKYKDKNRLPLIHLDSLTVYRTFFY